MPNYQKMYYILCAAASKAADARNFAEAQMILQEALYEAEEMYIRGFTTLEEIRGMLTHGLVDELLSEFPANRVYLAIHQLRDKLKDDLWP